MSKNLVIVESPAKAKTINKILGKDFIVKASMGHVRDLPQKELGVDLEHNFKPKYVTIKTREKVLKELKALAAVAERIYLAPDPDREGEAIAWHLAKALGTKIDADRFLRVTYNEITASAIRQAFEQPRQLDQNKVDSQQARRVLDRIVGYQVSPLLWRRFRGATSAGRVQSVALRLVCERERLILGFQSESYWLLGARVRKLVDPRDAFDLRLARIDGEKADIKQEELAHRVRADLEGRRLIVKALNRREISKRAVPSFITSTLQQAGSSKFGFAPARTMKIAQKLYEGMDFGEGAVGLITYMRTDSVAISTTAQQACREFVARDYGVDYLPDRAPSYKSREGAQEAHEAIRPTDVFRTPESLTGHLEADEMKLYRLIWQRFVASQMAPARIAQLTAEVDAPPAPGAQHHYLFRASSSEVIFPGYLRVYGIEEDAPLDDRKPDSDDPETRLPPLVEGEELEKMEWLEERKETQPPARYSEATLIKALEENGVGRPSTFAQTMSTILDRNYVEKEKRTLKPTSIGLQVNDFLVGHLPILFDVNFTAQLEKKLDEVESGAVEWTVMMRDFYEGFQGWVAGAKEPPADVQQVKSMLALLAGVKEWAPATKQGRKKYDDQEFVRSLGEQLTTGEKAVSTRQLDALIKMACRYREQLPQFGEAIAGAGLEAAAQIHHEAAKPPSAETLAKLQHLTGVTFDGPREVRKKIYDDGKFIQSLRGQAESGRRLTENQERALDRIFMKYVGQIENGEALGQELGVAAGEPGDPQAGPLLELMGAVAKWAEPVQRGKRLWDDKAFYDSLHKQFGQKKQLSIRQVGALKKLLRRYADQVPGYDALMESHGLLPRRKSKAEAAAEEEA